MKTITVVIKYDKNQELPKFHLDMEVLGGIATAVMSGDAISQIEQNESDLEKEVAEKEYWENKATELADDIGDALGFDVGEHSNLNCPVQSAIDGVYEMRSQIEEWQKLS